MGSDSDSCSFSCRNYIYSACNAGGENRSPSVFHAFYIVGKHTDHHSPGCSDLGRRISEKIDLPVIIKDAGLPMI